MALYMDEEQVWKCPKHPSKRRRSGICPTCLRERLITLCPECANTRPCSCCRHDSSTLSSSSSSSNSSSSFSIFQFSRGGSLRAPDTGAGETGRVSTLIESEPAFRKSRSLAVPFLRSRSKYVDNDQEFINNNNKPPLILPPVSRKKINFWSVFKVSKNKKCDMHSDNDDHKSNTTQDEDYSTMMMRRSRSVAVGGADRDSNFSPAVKRRGWYFPSPIKAFRQSKLQLHQRSPMHRG
uniref:uncharacterized protein LOC122579601 n=1 Tax=Erigeron canadensis TaxID=72917 RepID=UPI001CB91EBD|nr:uncharacterized protein LOC122579601 [Erigeron canadensis]